MTAVVDRCIMAHSMRSPSSSNGNGIVTMNLDRNCLLPLSGILCVNIALDSLDCGTSFVLHHPGNCIDMNHSKISN